MKTNPNDPISGGTYVSYGKDGQLMNEIIPSMNIRQYYAGLALQGLLATEFTDPFYPGNTVAIAERAVEFADALINELNKA